ncbi:unnamed protein product [Withania somnifera]
MGAKGFILLVVGIYFCIISITFADEGTATYYTAPYVPSSCYGYQNNGVMIAAASDKIWGNRAACGRMYRVTCIRSVVVKVVDYCPPGCRGTIDLSQEAFSQIANLDAGKIKINFNRV